MPLSTDELIEKCVDQRTRGRYEEALVSALAAVESDRENSSTWWQLGLSRNALNDWKNAVSAFEKVTELDPCADNAWAYLGSACNKLGHSEAAEAAYLEALQWDEMNRVALIGMAAIYKARDLSSEHEDELAVLEKIENSETGLNNFQNARLGILHYNLQRYHEAIKYWKLANAQHSDVSYIHNIGLAYNSSAISQDADAIDMWRLSLAGYPNYQPSLEMIDKVMPRMTGLSQSVTQAEPNLIKRDEYYDNYLNPFEIMNFQVGFNLAEMDIKTQQKYKKNLIQEIDLEDGILTWLDGAQIDKSRAMKSCDELNDEILKQYHYLVFSDQNLLSFLTKGSVDHFLVGQESSLSLLAMLDNDPGFCEWVGGYFVKQYDRVLSRALDGSNLHVIECLLDGRRWVTQAQEYECFENPRRVIDRLMQPLRELAEASGSAKPSYVDIAGVVEQSLLLPKLNMLPLFFEVLQNEAVRSLRGIAITCVNQHADSELSSKILNLCQKFKFKSRDLKDRLDTDANDLNDILLAEKKNEVFLTLGDNKWQITKSGVAANDRSIDVGDVEGVRWGSVVTSNNNSKDYSFTVSVCASDANTITFHWSVSSRSSDIEKQQTLYSSLVDALFAYILPSLHERTDAILRNGGAVNIGPCILTNEGVIIKVKGWFSTSDELISWDSCSVSVDNGEMTIKENGSYKKKVTFNFKDTVNAPLLIDLANRRKLN
jgi:tetratricopeptide (TPR) repeat protein